MLQRTTTARITLLAFLAAIGSPAFAGDDPPRNDRLGDAANGPDATSLRLTPSEQTLRIELGLVSTHGLNGPAGTSTWVGFVDLDTDGDRSTGQLPSASFLTRREPQIGTDLLLPLDSFSGTTLQVVSAEDQSVLATVPAHLDDDGLVAELPTSLLPSPTASVRAAAVLGTAGGLTDVVPDEGYVTTATQDGATRLRGGRFAVDVEWTDYEGKSGTGTVAHSADDSVLFWFFDAANWELLLKILDGCGVNGHYWVYSAATTDVEYRLRVTDTQTGTVRTYTNALGERQPFVGDTQGFATCP